jgi:hypothetical protein
MNFVEAARLVGEGCGCFHVLSQRLACFIDGLRFRERMDSRR